MQVQFTGEQVRWLKTRAIQEYVSVSEIVRRAVNASSKEPFNIPIDERRQRAIEVAGRFASGLNDVAARHDDYLADAYHP